MAEEAESLKAEDMDDNAQLSQRNNPSWHLPKCLAAAMAAIFVLDVLLRLRLPSWLLSSDQLLAFPRHFAGLLLTEGLLACCIVASAMITGSLLSKVVRRFDSLVESTALMAAALGALPVLADIAYPPRGGGALAMNS